MTPRRITGISLILFLVVQGIFFLKTAGGAPITFSKDGFLNVGQTFAPLIAIAAFVERAVEVVISTWRAPGAVSLQRKVDSAGAAQKDAAAEQEALQNYKLITQSYAFGVALMLSLCASAAGVRALASLIDREHTTMSPRQHFGFTVIDVTLTSLLLAGGSDGIHQVVTTITKFLDASKGKMNT